MYTAKDSLLTLKHNNEPLPPTFESYGEFQYAYDRFNGELFGGQLPRCLITLQRGARCYGYFCGDRFASHDGRICDEIALNPRYFGQEPTIEVLGTLVHEMVHLWQHHFGKPGRGGYHNKQWAQEMHRVGLHPSDTGRPGGAETGRFMSHYIVAGGLFEIAAMRLLATPLQVSWFDAHLVSLGTGGSEGAGSGAVGGGTGVNGPSVDALLSGKRSKFSCPSCGANAWGKQSLRLLCLNCQQTMVIAGLSRKPTRTRVNL